MSSSKKDNARELTKSELLLSKIGELVTCDICHREVLMTTGWMMTAQRDSAGNFVDKKAVCPLCQAEVMKNCEILVSI